MKSILKKFFKEEFVIIHQVDPNDDYFESYNYILIENDQLRPSGIPHDDFVFGTIGDLSGFVEQIKQRTTIEHQDNLHVYRNRKYYKSFVDFYIDQTTDRLTTL